MSMSHLDSQSVCQWVNQSTYNKNNTGEKQIDRQRDRQIQKETDRERERER